MDLILKVNYIVWFTSISNKGGISAPFISQIFRIGARNKGRYFLRSPQISTCIIYDNLKVSIVNKILKLIKKERRKSLTV